MAWVVEMAVALVVAVAVGGVLETPECNGHFPAGVHRARHPLDINWEGLSPTPGGGY